MRIWMRVGLVSLLAGLWLLCAGDERHAVGEDAPPLFGKVHWFGVAEQGTNVNELLIVMDVP